MIKVLLAGIWSVALLSGSFYFFGGNMADPGAEGGDQAVKLEHVKLETMSITIIRDNILQGYLILDVSFELDEKNRKVFSAPVELILMDAVNKNVFTDKQINIDRLDQFDFEDFKIKVKKTVNAKLGEAYANDVLIERLDFISYDEIREKKLRG